LGGGFELKWSEVPSQIKDLGLVSCRVPDFSTGMEPVESYAAEVDKGGGVFVFYVLSAGDIGFPLLSDSQVAAEGIDPNRSISGGP